MASKGKQGWYVYGIVEGDIEVEPQLRGVGEPPAKVEVVRSGEVAALVSPLDVEAPIGTTEDLFAHEEVLDAAAAEVPVLPMRFGAVVASRDAVVKELLEPYADQFADALHELTGEEQFVVRARYDEGALIGSILDENPELAKLSKQLGSADDPSTKDTRIRFGELASQAVEAKREADTQAVIDAIGGLAKATSIRPPTHEMDAAHVAVLVEAERAAELEEALTQLADDWKDRAEIRLRGPMAAYDFVLTPQV
jgi:hypothetical protein